MSARVPGPRRRPILPIRLAILAPAPTGCRLPPEERVVTGEVLFEGDPPGAPGRLREVVMGPDGRLWLTTSNCDGRGGCPPGRDRVLRLVP